MKHAGFFLEFNKIFHNLGFFDQSRIFSDDQLQTFDIKAFKRQDCF